MFSDLALILLFLKQELHRSNVCGFVRTLKLQDLLVTSLLLLLPLVYGLKHLL